VNFSIVPLNFHLISGLIFPLKSNWRIFAIASFFALLSASIAAVVPARRAARLDPVQTIRGAA
jgi:lipoprotein-releasing system permease protein